MTCFGLDRIDSAGAYFFEKPRENDQQRDSLRPVRPHLPACLAVEVKVCVHHLLSSETWLVPVLVHKPTKLLDVGARSHRTSVCPRTTELAMHPSGRELCTEHRHLMHT